MRSKTTWVLIADGGRARILSREGSEHELSPVEGMTFHHDLPKTSDLARDRQPRSFESVGHGRHPVDSGPDLHRQEKEKFALELAKLLDAKAAEKAYDSLVIVAPAKALGELRASISAAVRAKVAGELDKDLTKTPNHEVMTHLKDLL